MQPSPGAVSVPQDNVPVFTQELVTSGEDEHGILPPRLDMQYHIFDHFFQIVRVRLYLPRIMTYYHIKAS